MKEKRRLRRIKARKWEKSEEEEEERNGTQRRNLIHIEEDIRFVYKKFMWQIFAQVNRIVVVTIGSKN